MKKYNFWRSLLSVSYKVPILFVIFYLMRHHWPSWDLVLYAIAFCFFWDVLDFRNFQAFERKRLARKERLSQLSIGE